MKKAISYLLIFIGIQIVGGAIIKGLWSIITKNKDMTPAMLITTTVVCSVVAIALFLWLHWAEVSPRWLRTRPWMVLFWSVVASVDALIPSAWLQEQIPELPNWAENEFDMLLSNRWGYLTIGLMAPLAEEIVFRGAILKQLLKSQKLSPWGAIAISALFFMLSRNSASMAMACSITLPGSSMKIQLLPLGNIS